MAGNPDDAGGIGVPGPPGPGISYLTLGWRVEEAAPHGPVYWTETDARPGGQKDDHLYQVSAESIAHHTVIIAQSGSGKSFFLGRLMEELLLQTRARCLVLDPNADFRKVFQVEGEDLWGGARYDQARCRGKLPHEASRSDFESRWSNINVLIRTSQADRTSPYGPLRIWWPSLAVAFLAEDLNPMLRGELHYCHELMGDLANLLQIKASIFNKKYNLIDEFQRVLRLARTMPKDDFAEMLGKEFDSAQWENRLKRALEGEGHEDFFDEETESSLWKLGIKRSGATKELDPTRSLDLGGLESRIKEFISRAQSLDDSVSRSVERFYFGKIREALRDGIIKTEVEAEAARSREQPRLDVVDLPSLSDKDARLLAINAVLASEWDRARQAWSEALEARPEEDKRVPTFVVVDEAHNLMPARVRSRAEAALREQFRTLAAEGRKYGLFLILVSQRPDKLDPLVLSECENKAIMRLGSWSVLDHTRTMLGLEDHKDALDMCLSFRTGRVLLCGPWTRDGKPVVIFSAARRTVEGGRDLRSAHWALPMPAASPPPSAQAPNLSSGPCSVPS
jgi:hypothetical protein